MKKYMLICCCERDIEEPQFFDSYEEAYEAMINDYQAMTECDEEELNEVLNCPYDDSIESYSAYCTNKNHDDVDWKIFEVEV